jgi:hypothetical protein
VSSVSIEFILMLGYAFFLAVVALLLELAAGHAHRRSLSTSTVGFTYHPERDIWRCPEDQHLFPIFSDHAKGVTVYRAPASACNACRSKAACTDSDRGREIERKNQNPLEFGMQRFHRAFSLTLLVLALLILCVEFFRVAGVYQRAILTGASAVFCTTIWRLATGLYRERNDVALRQSSSECFDNPRRTSGSPWL